MIAEEVTMSKLKIDNGDEYIEKLVAFVSQFYADNPIFTELNLTDEQQNLLMDKLIMPKFKDIYDVSYQALRQSYFKLNG